MKKNCRRAIAVSYLLLVASANAQAQRLPLHVEVSNPQMYEVTITTTFVVPANETSQSGLRVAHALPTARPWDGLDGKLGASAITFQPASGRIQHLETNDSQSVIWEPDEGLWPGKKLEFVSRFRVRAVDRTFDLKKSTAAWSNSQQKRARVRSVDRKIDRTKSIANRSNSQQKLLGEITPSDDTRLDLIVNDIMKSHPPAEAALEFCKWVEEHIKYDASVPYGPGDLAAILTYKKGHCGHMKNVFDAMCSIAGIPTRTVAGLNLYKPDGVGHLNEIRTDFENAHTWAQVYLPGSGWVEIDPGVGEGAYDLPAQVIQNNTDFQNYAIWIREDVRWRGPDWEYRDGKWYSPYGIENHRAFRKLEANQDDLPLKKDLKTHFSRKKT